MMTTKVCDGLFLGDEMSCGDMRLIEACKIGAVVNCAGMQVENHWHSRGVQYMTFEWETPNESEDFDFLQSSPVLCTNQGLFDPFARNEDEKFTENSPCHWLYQLVYFVVSAWDHGYGVLIHSKHGQNRATSCVVAFLMGYFMWDVHKTISFLQQRRADLQPSDLYLEHLERLSDWLERRVVAQSKALLVQKFHTWDLSPSELEQVSHRVREEELHQNTYLNTEYRIQSPSKKQERKMDRIRKSVQWVDSKMRVDEGHQVLTSPFSRRPLPERPPGPSYNAMCVTGNWSDAPQQQQQQQNGIVIPSNTSQVRIAGNVMKAMYKSKNASEKKNKTFMRKNQVHIPGGIKNSASLLAQGSFRKSAPSKNLQRSRSIQG